MKSKRKENNIDRGEIWSTSLLNRFPTKILQYVYLLLLLLIYHLILLRKALRLISSSLGTSRYSLENHCERDKHFEKNTSESLLPLCRLLSCWKRSSQEYRMKLNSRTRSLEVTSWELLGYIVNQTLTCIHGQEIKVIMVETHKGAASNYFGGWALSRNIRGICHFLQTMVADYKE